MVGGVKICGALYTPMFEIAGQLFEAIMFRRICVVVMLGKRRMRLYPMVVAFANSFQFPSTHASTVNDFTRWPKRIYSCTKKRLNLVGLRKSIVNEAVFTWSSVAQ